MRLRTLLGRIGLPVTLVALATASAGLPAHADPDPAPELNLEVPGYVYTVAGQPKSVEIAVVNGGGAALTGAKVRFDAPAAVGLALPAGCAADACPVGDVAPGGRAAVRVSIDPTDDLDRFGEEFTVGLQGADGKWITQERVTAVRAPEGGVDLELAPIDDFRLAAGASADVPIALTNTGTEAPAGFGLVLTGDQFLDFPVLYSNCFAEDELGGTVCVFDGPVQPGDMVKISAGTPMRLHVAEDTPGPGTYIGGAFVVGLTDDDLREVPATARKSRGSALRAEPVTTSAAPAPDPSELNDWDNVRTFAVAVSANPANLVAVGGTFDGAVGDARTVKVGARNDGPAAARAVEVAVTLPAGVEVTEADERCALVTGGAYVCRPAGVLRMGDEALFSFTGKIKSGGAAGTVEILAQDGNQADNKAAIGVKVAPVTTSPSPSPSATTSPSPTSSPTPTATATTTTPAGGTGGGESLPITGAPVAKIAGSGGLLVLIGAAMLVLTRRRNLGPDVG
ncbi:hypothetical protein [Symbioplanes lichenis]|uniref:hypothetical protein n=1 Tax=Symbioplanes lichenis TaxID=1629072 RepID=UPI0027394F53|nr:hypothetical protein [Actinoplanes lichenis]